LLGAVAVAFGCYVTVLGAHFVGGLSVPDRPRTAEECDVAFNCLPPSAGLVLMLVLGLPAVLGLTGVSAIAAAVMVRWFRSPIMVGLASVGITVLIALLFVGVKVVLR
jgi:hypothetical protein